MEEIKVKDIKKMTTNEIKNLRIEDLQKKESNRQTL